jgi:peroxiredoxin/predicted 2-oxoglutarate/Fe(II)-dependent dioxygenase YbiX
MMRPTDPQWSFENLTPGDPAPWFNQRSTSSPNHYFDTAAGRYVVLCFFGTASGSLGLAAIQSVVANRGYFDDVRVSFFGVSLDPRDEAEARVRESLPGIRYFWDSNGAVSRLYGAIPRDAEPSNGPVPLHRFWLVLDPTLRVLRVVPFGADSSDAATLFGYLEQLPPPERFAGIEIPAPILFLPNVFEQDFCRRLIGLYEANGGEESGVTRVVDGKTVVIRDQVFKRRRDYTIADNPELIQQLQRRISRRIIPEIYKVYSFKATRIERYLISCYSAEDQGHFQAHRDNTTEGTAHRRFAVSINLNFEFEGGEIIFPEYGTRGYKPPTGGAVIFPCALLHAVSRVASGCRYAFKPPRRLRSWHIWAIPWPLGSWPALPVLAGI